MNMKISLLPALICLPLSFFMLCNCTSDTDKPGNGNGNEQTDPEHPDKPMQPAEIEAFCDLVNTNIASLHTVINAFENDDYVVSFEETGNDLPEDYLTYSIKFNESPSVNIWCRKDELSSNGVPKVNAAQDENGKWYWTMDGKWLNIGGSTVSLIDNDVSPQVSVKDDRWMMSIDGGSSWKDMAEAETDRISAGEYIFSDIYKKGSFLYFVLDNGKTIPVSTLCDIDILFPDADGAVCAEGQTVKIAYNIVGWDEATTVKCSCDASGWETKVETTDASTGYIVVTNTGADGDAAVTVTADNSTGDTISKALIFEKGVLTAQANASIVRGKGGVVDVEITTNVDYTVNIPADASWISVVDNGTKSSMRTETVKLAVDRYESGPAVRSATVSFIVYGKEVSTIYIEQTCLLDEPIDFADSLTKEYLISSSSPYTIVDKNRDGEISYREAAEVIEFHVRFGFIESFDEFQFFTSIESFGSDCFSRNYELNHGFNKKLKSITLPKSLTRIPGGAFEGCRSLTSIDIPDGVTSIGADAFAGCSLTSIDIPDGVTIIQSGTFAGCRMTSINIPDGVTSIGASAFSDCSSLVSIELPDGLDSIAENTFGDCSSLTSIDIPDGVTSIGARAFDGCSSLTSLDIPDGVTSIGNFAFRNCSNLASIKLPHNLNGSIRLNTFLNCVNLTSINIPKGVTSIGAEAFYNCHNLKEITFYSVDPPTISNEYSYFEAAFEGCNIKTAYVPTGSYEKYKDYLRSRRGFENTQIIEF